MFATVVINITLAASSSSHAHFLQQHQSSSASSTVMARICDSSPQQSTSGLYDRNDSKDAFITTPYLPTLPNSCCCTDQLRYRGASQLQASSQKQAYKLR